MMPDFRMPLITALILCFCHPVISTKVSRDAPLSLSNWERIISGFVRLFNCGVTTFLDSAVFLFVGISNLRKSITIDRLWRSNCSFCSHSRAPFLAFRGFLRNNLRGRPVPILAHSAISQRIAEVLRSVANSCPLGARRLSFDKVVMALGLPLE